MLAASIAIVTAITGYAALCWARPFTTCRRCKGTAQRTTIFGNPKPCNACHATGQRVRLGRRMHTHWSDLHHRGTRHPCPAAAPGAYPHKGAR